MTKEGKAREIIEQGGSCDGIACDFGEQNECPIFRMCELSGGNSCKSESKVSSCRDFIGEKVVDDNAIGNPRTNAPSKTLLDEFAMAAMAAIVGKNKPQTVGANEWEVEHMIAIGAYDYAHAMMKERARRDEMGNVKEIEK